MKPGRGFIAGASHGLLLPETSVTNVTAMGRTIRLHGCYR